MIKLQVIGNLGKDCVVNTVNGKTVINFNVAHSEKYKDAMGNQKERTTWVECAYWTDRTAVAQYLKKGTQVYAEGTPEVRSYTTSEGKMGASLSLRISSVQLLGGGRSSNEQEGGQTYNQGQGAVYTQQPAPVAAVSQAQDTNDDLPF